MVGSRVPSDRLAALSPEQRVRLRDRLRPADAVSGRALVAEGLRQAGVRHLLGIPGTPVDAVFSECDGRGLGLVATRHQTTAVIAAAAANHLAGELTAAVVVSAGPAVTNTATGLLVARDNGWPVVVLGGRRSTADEGAGYFQELDAVPHLAPITKRAATVRRAEDVVPMLHRAAETALSGTPGPVYLDLPEDVLFASAPPAALPPPVRTPPPAPADAEVADALALLRAAERPLLCLGEGLWWDTAPDALRHLVDHEGLPFITSSLGRGLVSDAHPLCLNATRQAAMAAADAVLMAGAWFDYRFQRGAALAAGARVVHVEPDPARRGRNVAAVQTSAASPGLFLSRLADLAEASAAPSRTVWHATVTKLRAPPEAPPPADGPLRAADLYAALRDVLPADAVVVVEGSFHMAAAQHGLRVERPRSWLDAGWNGCMGSGLPMALGARLAFPGRSVVAVVGDTGVGMSGVELETAVRHGLPVVLVVANNGGINGRRRQRTYLGDDGPPAFAYAEGLRYDGFARSLGADAARVDAAGELRPTLRAALAGGRPACVDVVLEPFPDAPRFW